MSVFDGSSVVFTRPEFGRHAATSLLCLAVLAATGCPEPVTACATDDHCANDRVCGCDGHCREPGIPDTSCATGDGGTPDPLDWVMAVVGDSDLDAQDVVVSGDVVIVAVQGTFIGETRIETIAGPSFIASAPSRPLTASPHIAIIALSGQGELLWVRRVYRGNDDLSGGGRLSLAHGIAGPVLAFRAHQAPKVEIDDDETFFDIPLGAANSAGYVIQFDDNGKYLWHNKTQVGNVTDVRVGTAPDGRHLTVTLAGDGASFPGVSGPGDGFSVVIQRLDDDTSTENQGNSLGSVTIQSTQPVIAPSFSVGADGDVFFTTRYTGEVVGMPGVPVSGVSTTTMMGRLEREGAEPLVKADGIGLTNGDNLTSPTSLVLVDEHICFGGLFEGNLSLLDAADGSRLLSSTLSVAGYVACYDEETFGSAFAFAVGDNDTSDDQVRRVVARGDSLTVVGSYTGKILLPGAQELETGDDRAPFSFQVVPSDGALVSIEDDLPSAWDINEVASGSMGAVYVGSGRETLGFPRSGQTISPNTGHEMAVVVSVANAPMP